MISKLIGWTVLASGFAALVAACPLPASAQGLGDRTPCSVSTTVMDSGDRERVGTLVGYIESVMNSMDSAHTEKGEPGIVAQLSDEGLTHLVAAVTVNCRDHPTMTIYNSTAFVYRGTREMQKQLGIAR
jgi:hypothetical protein